MLHALNDIGSSVTKGTEAIKRATQHFMDYAYCNPDAQIIYQANEMIFLEQFRRSTPCGI